MQVARGWLLAGLGLADLGREHRGDIELGPAVAALRVIGGELLGGIEPWAAALPLPTCGRLDGIRVADVRRADLGGELLGEVGQVEQHLGREHRGDIELGPAVAALRVIGGELLGGIEPWAAALHLRPSSQAWPAGRLAVWPLDGFRVGALGLLSKLSVGLIEAGARSESHGSTDRVRAYSL